MKKINQIDSKSKNSLNKEIRKHKFYIILYIFVIILEFFLIAPIFLPLAIVIGFCFVLLITKNNNKIKAFRAGLVGEQITVNILKELLNDFYIISDVKLKTKQGSSQIDNIIVSKNGITIVETKNHTGIIEGDVNDNNLLQTKVSRGQNVYKKKFYNPIKQVNTHNWRLREYLKINGFKNIPVKSAVLFVNPNAKIYIKNLNKTETEVYVYNQKNILLNYIQTPSNHTKRELTDKEVEKIVKKLRKINRAG